MASALALLLSFSLGLILVPAVQRIARARGIVARPRQDRWHREPTALLGGIAISLATVSALALATGPLGPLWGILLAAGILFVIGLIDDQRPLRPATKLVAQVIAAAIAIKSGARVWFFDYEVLNLAASFFWIVAITNAVNLLDNMDGLAAGVVSIAVAALVVSYGQGASDPEVILSLGLVGALIAFLLFNYPPASIFMGDCGSLFIGFLLACLSLHQSISSAASFVGVPTLILLVPILDTTLVTITRVLRGQSISQGGRDHTSHRLVMLGLSERQAVALLWSLAAVAGGSAIFSRGASTILGPGTLPVAIIVAFALIGLFLSRLRIVDSPISTPASSAQLSRLPTDLRYKRRLAEVVGDFLVAVCAYAFAYRLRLEFDLPVSYWKGLHESLPITAACTVAAFSFAGIYGATWRWNDRRSWLRLPQGSALAVLLSVTALTIFYRFEAYPRSVFPIYGGLLLLGSMAVRVLLAALETDRRESEQPRTAKLPPLRSTVGLQDRRTRRRA